MADEPKGLFNWPCTYTDTAPPPIDIKKIEAAIDDFRRIREEWGRSLIASFDTPRNIFMGTQPRCFLDPPRPHADEEEAFLRGIVAAPGDPGPRLIFADRLAELGLVKEEAGQRWLAKHKKRPMKPEQRSMQYVLRGGWYVGGRTDRMEDEVCLPRFFWDGGKLTNDDFYHLCDPLECERWFLRVACLRVHWDADGEPRDPFSVRVGDRVCSDKATGRVRIAEPHEEVYGTVVDVDSTIPIGEPMYQHVVRIIPDSDRDSLYVNRNPFTDIVIRTDR